MLFANRDEADALDLCTRALPPGLTAIVKDGPRAVTVLAAGAAPVSVPVRPVEDVRDTTGAGDAFAAGTLAAWMGGADLPAACAAGNAHGGARPRHAWRRHPARSTHMTAAPLTVADEVADAVAGNRPVVALESTIFSNLGLPTPHNREALQRCSGAIRAAGAVPAITAVIDGVWRVGLDDLDVERMLSGTRKVAERDLSVAAAQRWEVGVTTVSATVALCHLAGVRVFATGGIGGVHRGAEVTGDVSADLDAIASHPVVTVCAGAKAFLDLPRTLEYLEMAGVPVLGWQHDWFPAFYTRSSGIAWRIASNRRAEVAATLVYRSRADSGVLLTVPIPEADELDPVARRVDRRCAGGGRQPPA